MKWFFRWIQRGLQRLNQELGATLAKNVATSVNDTDTTMSFSLTKVENGHVLKLSVPTQNPKTQFQHHTGCEEKIWIIPEGENVIEFITRALVEERLK